MRKSPAQLGALETRLLGLAAGSGGKLTDPEFPPDSRSVGDGAEGIIWKRADYHEPLLKDPGRDANQGKVGDCWFLSVVNLVARRPDLARNLLLSEHPEAGFYIFSFFKEGGWRLVYIDDFLPQRDGRPVFASTTSHSPFFPLIEKAYAKMRGSYRGLSMGSVSYALTDLTAAPCDVLDVNPRQPGGSSVKPNAWSVMGKVLQEGWLVSASPYYPGLPTGKEIGATGLYANHAYSLNRVAQVGEEKLVELRNPWGRLEWKGAWADGDAKWATPGSRQLNHTPGEDGDFWIGLGDFQRHFTKLIVCRLYEDDIGPKWQKAQVRGQWAGTTAGGNHSLASWAGNPGFLLTPSKPAPFFACLSQEDLEWKDRAGRTPRREYFSIGLAAQSGGQIFARTPSYVNSRDISLEFQADGPCLLVPATFSPGEESDFLLQLLCPVGFQIRLLNAGPQRD